MLSIVVVAYNNYAIKVMILKRLELFKQKLFVASMGSFSRGALSLKNKKKKVFLTLMKQIGLFKNVIWSVTSSVEEEELKNVIGKQAKCIIAEDLPRIEKIDHIYQKEENHLKVVFISRIAKKKNLLGAIEIISNLINIAIQFDIYGPIEDNDYWNECKQQLELLPSNISWDYKGECNSDNVIDTLSNYDVFLFPTLGENFGHVISEALIAGCLPIISDQTPWLDLEECKCGNVISLDNQNLFIKALERYSAMDQKEFSYYVNNAQNYIKVKNEESIKNTGYREIFNS